jgi:hypothetical protein
MISFIARSILTNQNLLLKIENNFKQISALKEDIAYYPLANHLSTQVETNKDKSKLHGEVFTPLWLVDEMIGQVDWKSSDVRTLDLCAGYGQFSIRLARFFYEKFPDFDLKKFLNDNHAFSELQLESCYKLLCIFSVNINLYIGDSTYLGRLPEGAKGIWVYVEKAGFWVCLTKTIKKLVKEKNFVKNLENIIIKLNEGYDKMSVTLDAMKKTAKNRLEYLSALNAATAQTSLQTVDTPVSIVSEMLEQVEEIEKKSILVLFNCEIVEQLIHKSNVPVENITFGYDTGSALEAKAVEKIYGVKVLEWLRKGPFDKEMKFRNEVFGGKKFDVCLSNPPYNRGLDFKILTGLLSDSLAKEFVIVHPINWLIDLKGNQELSSYKQLVGNNLKYVRAFSGNVLFGIKKPVPCGIIHIDFNYNGNITVQYFDDKFVCKNVNDITKYGSSWQNIAKPFMIKLKEFIKNNGSLFSNNKKQIDSTKHNCQISPIVGSTDVSSYNTTVCSDFYTLVKKDPTDNIGISKALDKPGNKPVTFAFESESERENFLNYCATKFARFALSFYKISSNISLGEMGLVPWLDFKQEWTDEKLFVKFDLNQETINYINNFIPSYHKVKN